MGAVAAVSLLVGGIGIMNIMLVSVTERTREIGIRLAIGAVAREVLLQFLVEAVVLACLGGIIGLLLALVATIVAAPLIQVPFIFDPQINLVAFFFSALIGIVFGYFPARRAASLNPIDALAARVNVPKERRWRGPNPPITTSAARRSSRRRRQLYAQSGVSRAHRWPISPRPAGPRSRSSTIISRPRRTSSTK